MSNVENINILLVDDHALFRDGMSFVLSKICGFNVIGQAANGVEFLECLNSFNPDIVLMDISMPEMDGIEATLQGLKRNPNLKIITLSSYGQEVYYYKMIKVGVLGFVQKNANKEELEEAIREVHAGNNYFPPNILRNLVFKVGNDGEDGLANGEIRITNREKEVLSLICHGFSNNDIAEKLFISPKTVDNHRTNLLSKTNTKNAANLVMYAIKNHIIEI